MNVEVTLTRSQQRMRDLINADHPLSDGERDELYRCLHADYMRKWRAAKAAEIEKEAISLVERETRKHEELLLERVRLERKQPLPRRRP